MVNKHALSLLIVGVSILCAQTIFNQTASAAYQAGRILDDGVLLDARSMNAGQVQSFLGGRGGQIANKSFVMNCDAAGQQAKQIYQSMGAPCGHTTSAANIIYYSAQVYGISPKVIMATMQKEQSLITATNPTDRQYSQAMGYACPTSGNCSDSSNFFWQIDNGAWVLRYHFERARGNMNWWSPSSTWTCGTEKNLYKPNLYPGQNVRFYDTSGTHYATIYIQNSATSSFYCYTPHAYNNPQGLYGRAPYGTTGLYYSGSYNFVTFFDAWWGTTHNGIQIDMIRANQDITATYNTYKNQLGSPTSEQVPEFTTDGRVWQNFQNGTIIWTPNYGAHPLLFGSIYDRWRLLGGSLGTLGVPSSASIIESDDGRVWQNFRSGTVIYSQGNGAWEVLAGPIGDKWRSVGGSRGTLGRPTSGVAANSTMRKQNFENGVVARRDFNTPAYTITAGIYQRWQGNQATLKAPTMDAVRESSDGRVWQYFDGGLALTNNSNTWIIRNGAIHEKWKSLGGSTGKLGKPVSNQVSELDGRVWQQFEKGYLIQKNSQSPAYEALFGTIYTRWHQLGGSTGDLGTPQSSVITESDGRMWQNFENGTIIWSQNTGAWEVQGGFYTFWKQYGGSLGRLGKPTSARKIELNDVRWQNFERGKATWSPVAGWTIN